jgi:type IV pilus assembly protein PilA
MGIRGPDGPGVRGCCAARATLDQRGFTLIELLVVMLVLSLLAVIAIPAFFGQRDKARDAEAKADLAGAQLAIETYAIDHDGTYTGANRPTLVAIEGALSDSDLTVVNAGGSSYQLRVISDTGTSFNLQRESNGAVGRSCAPPGSGGCPAGGGW